MTFDELFKDFLQFFDMPFFVENDVNLAALGELGMRKLSSEQKDLCYLSLGSGFGSGIILNGKLWRGVEYGAGEVGNMTLSLETDENGDYFPLERQINISSIEREFNIDLFEVSELSDEMKERIISYVLPVLTVSVYNLTILLDLYTFVLGGMTAQKLGNSLIKRLEENVNNMLKSRRKTIHVIKPSSEYVSLIGASNLVLDKLLLTEFERD